MRTALAMAAFLALAACGQGPGNEPRAVEDKQPPTRPAAVTVPPPAPTMDDQAFVAAAAGTDAFELQAAQVAVGRSNNRSVRDFAFMMIRDHKHSSNELAKAVAEAEKPVALSATMPPPRQQALSDLAAAGPADFDRTYLRTQVEAHEDALKVLQTYSEIGQTTSLKAFASNTVGAVQHHHDQARRLQSQLEAKAP
jgi:putative membrane protein